MSERAVIYVAGKDMRRSQQACLEHCAANGYELVALVVDQDGHQWTEAVLSMLRAGSAEVVVVASDDQVPPPPRTPRVETVNPTRRSDRPRALPRH